MSASPLYAQNIVVNPGFDIDLSSWDLFEAFDVSAAWSPLDELGDPASGSIRGTLPAAGTFRTPIYASQCIPVTPDTMYTFGGSVLLPSASTPALAYGTLFVNTHASAGCTGNATINLATPTVTTLDVWTPTQSIVTTGPDDYSIRIHMRVFAPADTTLESHFDNLFVIALADEIFADGFD